MNEKIKYTLINSDSYLNKSFDMNGNKKSRATIYSAESHKIETSSVKVLLEQLQTLTEYEAIILGITKEDHEIIVANKNVTESTIARTKEYFKFNNTSFLLFDYDPSDYGFELKSLEHFVDVLIDIDPALRNCQIGVRYGSSYGIKQDNKTIDNTQSMHAYCAFTNVSDETVKRYKDYLIASAWSKGYGHIQKSTSDSLLRRQVFDSSVFSPERLILEAPPTLAKGITRLDEEIYLSSGVGLRDLNNIEEPSKDGELIFSREKIRLQNIIKNSL